MHKLPAFPSNRETDCTGMDLRDYFAAKAMQGDWASQGEDSGIFQTDIEQRRLDQYAELYFRMADAMMKARAE